MNNDEQRERAGREQGLGYGGSTVGGGSRSKVVETARCVSWNTWNGVRAFHGTPGRPVTRRRANDGFTGVAGGRLPKHVGDTETIETNAYDAGTELNTEDFADLVPPCPMLTGVESDEPGTGMSNPALAENGVIHAHEGILGIADLDPELHGWTDPVARIEVTRVN